MANETRRFLLAGGEALAQAALRPARGGKKFHPQSADQAYEVLAPKARELERAISEMPVAARGGHVVFEATMLPNYLGTSYHPVALLSAADLYVVGSRSGSADLATPKKLLKQQPTRTLYVAGEPAKVQRFVDFIAAGPQDVAAWDNLRMFNDIALPSPSVIVRGPKVPVAGALTWEAVLNPLGRTPGEHRHLIDEAFERWTAWVELYGGIVVRSYRREVNEVTFVPVLLETRAVDDAAQFNLLRAIRPMPSVRPMPAQVLRSAKRKAPPPKHLPRFSDESIAVFDGGLQRGPYIDPYIESYEHLTNEPEEPDYVEHGTLVTSAALYGHIDGAAIPRPVTKVRHYRVFPAPRLSTQSGLRVGVELYWILDQIEKTVAKDSLRLVNLSFGPDECVDDAPSRWTAVVDKLTRAHGCVFVSAVGNNGKDDAKTGMNRVQPPSDAVNAIGVGACKITKKSLKRSPYSAVGPGREGQRVQPTVVTFGGDGKPFIGVDGNGDWLRSEGTSFASPAVVRQQAWLYGLLEKQRRRPEVARAFTAHFARRVRGHRYHELGYGAAVEAVPSIFECTPNQVSVLYDAVLERKKPTAFYLPVPLIPPDERVTIEWTISYLTDVDPNDPVDYTRCGLELTFRPNTHLFKFSRKGFKEVYVDIARDKSQAESLLRSGWERADVPTALTPKRAKHEGQSRGDGKWDTLVRGKVSLDATEVAQSRIDLSYLRRERGVLVDGPNVPKLPITLVATVSTKTFGIYDAVRLAYPVLVPMTIQTEIEV